MLDKGETGLTTEAVKTSKSSLPQRSLETAVKGLGQWIMVSIKSVERNSRSTGASMLSLVFSVCISGWV